jgi:hypothetical protein
MVTFGNEVRVAKTTLVVEHGNACGCGITRTCPRLGTCRNADGIRVRKIIREVRNARNTCGCGIIRTLRGSVRVGAGPRISALPHLPHPLIGGGGGAGKAGTLIALCARSCSTLHEMRR